MMGPSKSTVMALTRELAPMSLQAWTEACGQSLEAGGRLVTLFGRADGDKGDGVVVTAVLQSPGSGLGVLRSRAPRGAHYPSLTARFPAAQVPERIGGRIVSMNMPNFPAELDRVTRCNASGKNPKGLKRETRQQDLPYWMIKKRKRPPRVKQGKP